MQMFIISPLLILPMWHIWNKKGALLSFSFSMIFHIGALVTMISLSVIHDWPAVESIAQ